MFTSVDILGVQRGRCKHTDCDCAEFMRENPPRSDGSGAAIPHGWCVYCGHSPAFHGRLEYIGKNVSYLSVVLSDSKH